MASTPRPEYHFTPARNWMNDPNGLIHHNGVWHLFFQHNPDGPDWGNMSWGHATSPDLVHWIEQPLALSYTPDEQVFSGSVVADGDTLTAVYTSVSTEWREAQSLAFSQDGGTTWTRYAGNPVLDRGSTAFRDPKVFRHDDHWVLVAVEAEKHMIVLYRSADLLAWQLLSELEMDVGPGVRAIECPDLFPLAFRGGQTWVLVFSLLPDVDGGGSATRYLVGDFDGTRFRPRTATRRMDHGPDFYAAATYTDAPDGRRVAIAWMNNWDYAGQLATSPWRGAMSLPRELSLADVAGVPTLVQSPVRELAGTNRLELDTGRDGSIEIAGLRLAWSGGRLRCDRDTFPASADVVLPPGPLHVYTDHGSAEVFSADGTVAFTALTFDGLTPPRAT